MSMKTVTAGTMAEALKLVEQTLGAHAVILHTRHYKRGGVLGFGAKTVVEITAADGRELGRQRRRDAGPSPRAQLLAQRNAQRERATPDAPQRGGTAISRMYGAAQSAASAPVLSASVRSDAAVATPSAPRNAATSVNNVESTEPMAGDLIKKAYDAAKAEMQTAEATADVAHEPVQIASIAGQADQLAEEMRAVKQLVARMMQEQKRAAHADDAAPASGSQDKLFEQYLALIEQEVADELADEIVREIRSAGGGLDVMNDDACKAAVLDRLAAWMPVDEDAGACDTPQDGRPRTIALVGPTGVGKTTTIAKLAATFKLKQNKRVALITLDTYRIAAVDQLKTYADIIGVPLQVVGSPDEMAQAVRNCADMDVVLIDTAGRSQRDDKRLSELSAFVAAADPHETHLCIASNCTERVMLQVVERFSAIKTDRILFTKLDEAVTYGTLLNVARSTKKKLSYITTGQEVPHQIEPGSSRRMAELVLGEGGVDG